MFSPFFIQMRKWNIRHTKMNRPLTNLSKVCKPKGLSFVLTIVFVVHVSKIAFFRFCLKVQKLVTVLFHLKSKVVCCCCGCCCWCGLFFCCAVNVTKVILLLNNPGAHIILSTGYHYLNESSLFFIPPNLT